MPEPSASKGSQKISLTLAGAGAGSRNILDNVIEAKITDGSDVTAASGIINVTADNSATVKADAGALALALGFQPDAEVNINVSVGGSAADNTITDEVRAQIDNSKVEAEGVSLLATSTAMIDSVTVAGAGSVTSGGEVGVSVALGGAASVDEISQTIEASIQNGSETDPPIVSVISTDVSTVDSLAVGGSISVTNATGAAAAIGISLAQNTINNQVSAKIDGVSEINGGIVTVKAMDDSTINSHSIAAAVSVTVDDDLAVAISGGGAVAENVILSRVNASIENSSLGETGNLVGNVDVDASSSSAVDAVIGAISLGVGIGTSSSGIGVGVAIGVAVARNFFGWDFSGEDGLLTGRSNNEYLSADEQVG